MGRKRTYALFYGKLWVNSQVQNSWCQKGASKKMSNKLVLELNDINQSKMGDLINRNSAQRVQTSTLECIFSLRVVAGHKNSFFFL